MSSIADSILHLHGWMALAIVFALPALESSAFIGFIFPGETAAIIGGVLSYEHRVNLAAVMAAVVVGAILGDTVGYLVGHRWGGRILEGPLARWIKAEHVERGRQTLSRKGGWAVFLGRFTAALRVLVPGIAGMARMPYRRFVLFNIAGGVCWGITFVLVGFVAGASWRSVAHTASRAGLIALATLAGLLLVVLIIRRFQRRRATPDTESPPQASPEPLRRPDAPTSSTPEPERSPRTGT
jgi:undecaprenyl-diphosphatase